MIRLTLAFALLTPTFAFAAPETPAEQYQKLVTEFEEQGGARLLAGRFLELAEQHPQDPVAVDALMWVVKHVRGRGDTTKALKRLAQHHAKSDKLQKATIDIAGSRSIAAEPLLRALFTENPDKTTRALAGYHLALLLELESGILQQLHEDPELAPRVLQYYGQEYGQHLVELTAERLSQQREALFETLEKSYADVEVDDTTIGTLAQDALFAMRHLSVGSVAPEIEGEDIDGKQFKLSDYRGKVVMISFWGHW